MQGKQAVNLRLDLRVLSVVLLVVIVVMLALWQPWRGDRAGDTVNVVGEATVKATPDEYMFMPYYQVKSDTKAAALAGATDKSSTVVKGLKDNGVAESSIKTSVSGYEDVDYGTNEPASKGWVYSVSITARVADEVIAQKVQDYLLTTEPEGDVTPMPTLSDTKRHTVEGEARDLATKDARAKADQTAKNLGFRLGRVKSVSDTGGFNMPYPVDMMAGVSREKMPVSALDLHPGENDLTYSVQVTYYVR